MKAAELTRPRAGTDRLWTYREMVAELPETNQSVELWNGEIILSSAPHPRHQEIVLNFAQALKKFVASETLGKVYWIVDPDSETIEVFALVKGVYQLHSRAVGAQKAKSRLLPGFGLSFRELLR